ncbi:MAG: holo-ACP synthase [Thermomicrobia bacterium]|nr:holo-ACP synthase [Thermomicrobia bacterium]
MGADPAGSVATSADPRLAIGVDSVEIARIAAAVARYGERFLSRVYTADERGYAGVRAPALAVRFAAKEATAKALGTGIGPVGWRNIEIRNDAAGKPLVILHGAAAAVARRAGFLEWQVSVTHSRDLATAFVVGFRAGMSAREPGSHQQR